MTKSPAMKLAITYGRCFFVLLLWAFMTTCKKVSLCKEEMWGFDPAPVPPYTHAVHTGLALSSEADVWSSMCLGGGLDCASVPALPNISEEPDILSLPADHQSLHCPAPAANEAASKRQMPVTVPAPFIVHAACCTRQGVFLWTCD